MLPWVYGEGRAGRKRGRPHMAETKREFEDIRGDLGARSRGKGEAQTYLGQDCGRNGPVGPLVLNILVAVILSTHKGVLRTLPEWEHGVEWSVQ